MGKVKDCVALAKSATINERYDMTANDIQKLLTAYRGDPASLVCESFKYGYVQGEKAARKEAKEKAAATL